MSADRVPPGLGRSGDLRTAAGIMAERQRLEALRREGRIDAPTLAAGLDGLDAIENCRRMLERERAREGRGRRF